MENQIPSNQPCSDPIIEAPNYERTTLLLTLFAWCAGHPEIEVEHEDFGYRLREKNHVFFLEIYVMQMSPWFASIFGDIPQEEHDVKSPAQLVALLNRLEGEAV